MFSILFIMRDMIPSNIYHKLEFWRGGVTVNSNRSGSTYGNIYRIGASSVNLTLRISMNIHNEAGSYTIVSQIVAGSGNEVGSNNNTDSEKIDYFSNQD